MTASLAKKREAKVKAELQHKEDKVAAFSLEVAELERQQEMAQGNFERISRLIKKEVDSFEQLKSVEFKRIIVKYLEIMLASQERISDQWERYIPEIQQVVGGTDAP